MVREEEIKQDLIEQGEDPNDFNIVISGNIDTITPKWYLEHKRIAKKEDKPIIEDVNSVADMAVLTAMDKDELAGMLVYALQKIDELEVKING